MDIASRIRVRLDQLGLKPNAASIKAGLPRDAIRDILTAKSRNPRADTLVKIARALEMDPADLLPPGDDRPVRGVLPVPHGEIMLPIRFEVAAGQWLEHDDHRDEPYGFAPAVEDPRYSRWRQWLERVRGDSINKMIPDGALVHVIDAIQMGYEARHDDLVVVQRCRRQGSLCERTVKQVALTPHGPELWPRSHDKRWQSPMVLGEVDPDDDTTIEIVGLVIRAYISF